MRCALLPSRLRKSRRIKTVTRNLKLRVRPRQKLKHERASIRRDGQRKIEMVNSLIKLLSWMVYISIIGARENTSKRKIYYVNLETTMTAGAIDLLQQNYFVESSSKQTS